MGESLTWVCVCVYVCICRRKRARACVSNESLTLYFIWALSLDTLQLNILILDPIKQINADILWQTCLTWTY